MLGEDRREKISGRGSISCSSRELPELSQFFTFIIAAAVIIIGIIMGYITYEPLHRTRLTGTILDRRERGPVTLRLEARYKNCKILGQNDGTFVTFLRDKTVTYPATLTDRKSVV